MRIKIKNVDRYGLVYDVSKLLFEKHLNILSMEVKKDVIYLETEEIATEKEWCLLQELQAIENVEGIDAVFMMPHEEKLQNLKIVLDTVQEGILSTDRYGYITTYNPAAEAILHIAQGEALGKKLTEVLPCCSSLMATIQEGREVIDQEIFFAEKRSHYLVSSFPICDKQNELVGGVAVLKSMEEAQRIYRRFTEQPALEFENIFYKSEEMKQVVALAKRYADGDSTILIRGETGTGKELFARAIHHASQRQQAIFLTINCASIPETLLESELFGYEEGSFTGGRKGGKPGLFELANEGSLFLDEIGELSTHLQAKLLRVLQEHKVRRIGGKNEFQLDVRIIAATHRNLEMMLEHNEFRRDLYYRLNVIPLHLPPLRARKEDIPFLAQVFFDKLAEKLQREPYEISGDAFYKLQEHSWPGNIRELENIVERAVNMTEGVMIYPEHILFDNAEKPRTEMVRAVRAVDERQTLKEILEGVERNVLEDAMKQQASSRSIGKLLGISHTSVIRKLQFYHLDGKLNKPG